MCIIIWLFVWLCPPPIIEVQQFPPPQVRPDETSLYLPRTDIYSTITTFPLGTETWYISPWERQVGHFEGTAWEHESGNIVLGGHARYPSGVEGVFFRLDDVRVGDVVYLTINGDLRQYRVIDTRTVSMYDLTPVYPTLDNRVTLITCDIASYDATTAFYPERVVIVAVLVD